MANPTQALFGRLGFHTQPPSDIPASTTNGQRALFRALRIWFGLVWLYNSWTASSGVTKHAMAQFLGLPFNSLPVHILGNGVVAINLYIALALLLGIGMRPALWLGLLYTLIMWIWVEKTGGFNPAVGQTDAGPALPYFLALILAYNGWRLSQPAPEGDDAQHNQARLWIRVACIGFGALWAWDTLFKWHPYYLTHIVGYIAGAQGHVPGWVAAYDQGWIAVITFISPVLFGVLAALMEAAIAWSLLAGRWLRVFLPVGLVYTLVIWSTAEGFGGPYTAAGQTGMPGNILGNAVNYMLVFGFLMVAYQWPKRLNA